MNPWREEVGDLGRGLSGAFLFGAPLVFTMEMWQIATYIDGWRLLGSLLIVTAGNTYLAHFAGFKKGGGLRSSLAEAVEALGVGIVSSAAFLLVLNRLSAAEHVSISCSKILLEAIPLSIGACVANSVFGTGRDRNGEEPPPRDPHQAFWQDVGATVVGAVFVSFSIAPTEEVPLLALELSPLNLFGLIGFSLAVSYVIVFESGFFRTRHPRTHVGPFQQPLPETVLAYTVSLLVALVSLFLTRQIGPGDPAAFVLAEVLVLGVPSAIGGAAGRLVL